MREDKIIKDWLRENPPTDDGLPKGWEIRFGLRGLFLKYDSVEHAERKNMILRRDDRYVPFGYCYNIWQEVKGNMQEGDEIWRHGNDGGETIYLIRDGSIVYDENYNKHKIPKIGYHIPLSIF